MGLRQHDLEFTIDNVFEIDSYKSKMGEDSDIVTLSFAVKGDQPAKDLVKFIETGYDFVLDADKTSGEQNDGKYRVFSSFDFKLSASDSVQTTKSPHPQIIALNRDRLDIWMNEFFSPCLNGESIGKQYCSTSGTNQQVIRVCIHGDYAIVPQSIPSSQ